MDATVLRVATIAAALSCLGANYGSTPANVTTLAGSAQSQNFIVSADSTQFAQQVAQAAERYRRELALSWLGRELPPWTGPCPIHVTTGRQLGAGGATSFSFAEGQPHSWHMEVQGSRERVLDSVLPHEITHTILATHFGRPLPRWADEGAATSVEDVSERAKQEKLLLRFLTTDRGIAFNHMFAMKEYPRDILPLYSQGYSLARFLIAQHGRRTYVDYLADGMRWNNWTAATRKHYGYSSLADLQQTWLGWVRKGSPDRSPTQLASFGRQLPGKSTTDGRPASASQLVPLPHRAVPLTDALAADNAGDVLARRDEPDASSSWYGRQASRSRQADDGNHARPSSSTASTLQQLGRPQPPQTAAPIILDSRRPGSMYR